MVFAAPLEGTKVRLRSKSFADHYSRGRLFYRSQTSVEQAHIASALVFELSKVTLEHVRLRVLANLRNVDDDLAARVSSGLNMDLPAKFKPAVEPTEMETSPALRIIGKYPPSLDGRSVGIVVSDAKIIKAVKKAAEGEGATVKIVAPKIGGVTLKDGSQLKADGLRGPPRWCLTLWRSSCRSRAVKSF